MFLKSAESLLPGTAIDPSPSLESVILQIWHLDVINFLFLLSVTFSDRVQTARF